MTVWEDLLEVIIVGAIAGVGLSVAFAWAIRSVLGASTARREGRGSAVIANVAAATLSGGICVAAVAFALYSMIHH